MVKKKNVVIILSVDLYISTETVQIVRVEYIRVCSSEYQCIRLWAELDKRFLAKFNTETTE